MKNINTPTFWDKQFKKENDLLKSNKDGFKRWNAIRFDMVANLLPKGRILDVGCGLGHFCRYLIAKNPYIWKVEGTDFSEYAIKIANRNKIGESYTIGTAYKMPYPDNSFDAISAQEIIEHLSDTEAFLKECIRVLKSDGKLLITTPNARESKSIEKDHIREFEIKELNDILSKYGKVSVALSNTIINRVTNDSFTDNFVLYVLEVK